MPSIFISYRREDTSGEAGHLAADLRARFGRSHVFIDTDAIDPGADFEARIDQALSTCDVAFVLIGKEWLEATLGDGTRRLDHADDFVRREVAAALSRADVGVVPVLVEGAEMPAPGLLPSDLSSLAKRQAFELSNKRWQHDVSELSRIARRHGEWWSRVLSATPRWLKLGGPVAELVAVAAVIIVASGGSTAQSRPILVPATVTPSVDVCTAQLTSAVDGTTGPLECEGGKLNTLAWQYYAKFNSLVMGLGRYATEGQVINAICADGRNQGITTAIEAQAYPLASLYYGWRFVNPPDPTTTRC